jgi:hypothetical protein
LKYLKNFLKGLRKTTTPLRIVGDPVEIRTRHLQNTNKKRKSLIQPVRLIVIDMIVVVKWEVLQRKWSRINSRDYTHIPLE